MTEKEKKSLIRKLFGRKRDKEEKDKDKKDELSWIDEIELYEAVADDK